MSNQRLVAVPVVLGLAAACIVAAGRWKQEAADRTVALVADYSEVQAVAAFAGRTVDETLAALKAAGLTGVAVEEPTFGDLVAWGVLQCRTSGAGLRLSAENLGGQALAALTTARTRFDGYMSLTGFDTTARWPALMDAGAGLDPAALQTIRSHGLYPVARLRNSPGLTADQLRATLAKAASDGARCVIFSGDQVLGHPEQLDATRDSLVAAGLPWGRVEFSQQKGEAGLAERLLDGADAPGYLRVHSITVAEMAKLAPALAIERYRRAAQERGIRICFARLLLFPTNDSIQRNSDFVAAIAGALRASRLRLGEPAPPAVSRVTLPQAAAVGLLGVAAAAALCLTWLGGDFRRSRWLAWFAAIAIPGLALAATRPELYQKAFALLAGLAYPTIGARWVFARLSDPARPVSRLQAVGLLWGAAACSVAGGLCTVGLLADTGFRLHHDQFLGVKLTQLGPLLAVGLIAVTGLGLPGADRLNAHERLLAFWRSPVQIRHVAAAAALLVAAVILLVRSGNEGVEVSETELRLRALLENTLGARPRFKEMLLGHPALLLAGLAAMRGRQHVVPALVLVGTVGLVSTFNTFCHVHTPLWQSLLRTVHALWIGTGVGLFADGLLGASVWRKDRSNA